MKYIVKIFITYSGLAAAAPALSHKHHMVGAMLHREKGFINADCYLSQI